MKWLLNNVDTIRKISPWKEKLEEWKWTRSIDFLTTERLASVSLRNKCDSYSAEAVMYAKVVKFTLYSRKIVLTWSIRKKKEKSMKMSQWSLDLQVRLVRKSSYCQTNTKINLFDDMEPFPHLFDFQQRKSNKTTLKSIENRTCSVWSKMKKR